MGVRPPLAGLFRPTGISHPPISPLCGHQLRPIYSTFCVRNGRCGVHDAQNYVAEVPPHLAVFPVVGAGRRHQPSGKHGPLYVKQPLFGAVLAGVACVVQSVDHPVYVRADGRAKDAYVDCMAGVFVRRVVARHRAEVARLGALQLGLFCARNRREIRVEISRRAGAAPVGWSAGGVYGWGGAHHRVGGGEFGGVCGGREWGDGDGCPVVYERGRGDVGGGGVFYVCGDGYHVVNRRV